MSDISVEVNERVYPPTDETVVSRMCKYLLDHKRIPIQAKRGKSKLLLNRLEPTEKECTFCQNHLSKPIHQTNDAAVLTMDCLVAGVKTFYRNVKHARPVIVIKNFQMVYTTLTIALTLA